jgi:hypothetical protein
MGSFRLQFVRDIMDLDYDFYNGVVRRYIEQISKLAFVKSVYQIGSVRDPGISDVDLIVVVDEHCDPPKANLLSVFNNGFHKQSANIFLHDIHLHNQQTFEKIMYSNYCDNMRLLYGVDQHLITPEEPEKDILSLQIIFDFVASRLAQFQQFLASGQISVRGMLVRVSSIKHSYSLLTRIGIEDTEIKDFISKIETFRREHKRVSDRDLYEAFISSFYHFTRIVQLASRFFIEKYLNFYTTIDKSNSLKLNPQFTVKFIEDACSQYKDIKIEPTIYYPQEVFFHYLAYIDSAGWFAEKAKLQLGFSGDEVYDIDESYTRVLDKRLKSISDHLSFLIFNMANFSMRGNPGFLTAKDRDRKTEIFKKHMPGSYSESAAHPESQAYNMTLDKSIKSESLDKIRSYFDFYIENMDFEKSRYEQWVWQFFPGWQKRYGHIYHKKIVELFVTHQLLEIQEDDEYMDAAGGFNTYIDKIRCKKKYLQGIKIHRELRSLLGDDIVYIQGDAATIDLPDESLTKISCHHSFEHFQANSDSDFFKECQRLMQPGGRCCIIPIFIADRYVEVSRSRRPQCHYDKNSTYIVDPSARITGGESCGDYARIYNMQSFKKRIVDQVDRDKFNLSFFEVTIDRKSVPDLKLQCHKGITLVNHPYRVLVFERIN